MANQSPDRREVLALLARVAALSQFAGFSRWVCAAGEQTQARPATYRPQFFTPAEYQAIDQLSELIIPRDDSPGARDVGVPEFIDFMVAHDDDIQYNFRTGLAWLNAFAAEEHGQDFLNLPIAQQDALLRKLAYRNQQSPTEIQGQEFFKLVRQYTVIGYYTTRIGMQQIDDPSLRVYSSSPECPHKDDPEHRHLPPARY